MVALRTVHHLLKLEIWEQAIILYVNNCPSVCKCSGGRFVCTGAWGGRRTLTQQGHLWKASRR